jgi:adenylate cyclase
LNEATAFQNTKAMEKFTIELLGDSSFPISKDQTILQASLEAGVPHFHACGGKGKCSTCRILVKAGNENLTELTQREADIHKRIPFPPNVRLACQTYVKGENVQVHRMIRDETDIQFYIKEDTATDLEYTGEEKEMALFFLDIRNFTPFIETYLPFDVIHIMRRLFALFQNAIQANDGRIIETAGDGFYAAFGFDNSIKQAVENACKAGYQIFADLRAFNDQYMYKNFRHRFQVGIGLHAGRVIIGNIGIGVNNNLTVTGLPVNIAARLQAATKDLNNSFLISDYAFSYLSDQQHGSQQDIKLKGIKDEVSIHLIGSPFQA